MFKKMNFFLLKDVQGYFIYRVKTPWNDFSM